MLETGGSLYFWFFLLVYGVVMYLVSPRSVSLQAFFSGSDGAGKPVSQWWLTSSIFISWIFAKSVTNAANLGSSFGIVGGVAYAAYWLSIPVAGLVIYWLRTRESATGLVPFLIQKYGRGAAVAFSLAILIRLYNEVWSNTAVVGGYFGPTGSQPYYLGAVIFTFFTLVYSIKGGLRSSIVTDAIQTVIFVFFLGIVLFTIVPIHGPVALLQSGTFEMSGGVDLLLVALLQVLSYPFHDPVLTDRGFLNDEKIMLRSFLIAGALGFVCILLFSLVGIHAKLSDLAVSGNAPVAVGQSLGMVTFFVMNVIMMTSAGSTLDSTFSSISKTIALEFPMLRGKKDYVPSIKTGVWVMIAFAVLGNLPLFAGTEILQATTISGTMVIGLAPVFLMQGLVRYSPMSFHFSFWPGVILGILLASGNIPEALAIGTGKYALLLGTNVYGLLLCTMGYVIPLAFPMNALASEKRPS
ncbi:MAG: sodium:solute symporter [SAR324 cluster bacterium]|nr:sodium:solute symporter [SAR324 cluster bacterium]